jgi:hypothetical protein
MATSRDARAFCRTLRRLRNYLRRSVLFGPVVIGHEFAELSDEVIEKVWFNLHFLPISNLVDVCGDNQEDLLYLGNLVDLYRRQPNLAHLANARIFFGMTGYEGFLVCGVCSHRIIAVNERDVQVCEDCEKPMHLGCVAAYDPLTSCMDTSDTCQACIDAFVLAYPPRAEVAFPRTRPWVFPEI